jgi:hypothetical protein
VEPELFTRNGSLERVDLDGSNRMMIVPRHIHHQQATHTDFDEGTLHWCDREGMKVLRCDLDGSNVESSGGRRATTASGWPPIPAGE